MTIQAARAGFIAAHRAAMVDFFEDMMRVMRWFRDPAHHDAAVAVAANLTKQPAAGLAPSSSRKRTVMSIRSSSPISIRCKRISA